MRKAVAQGQAPGRSNALLPSSYAAVSCRQAWTHVAREQQVLVDRSEQQCAAVNERLLSVLQRHEASMDSACLDLQQQETCWVASLSQIQASQSRALVRSLSLQLLLYQLYFYQLWAISAWAWALGRFSFGPLVLPQVDVGQRVHQYITKRFDLVKHG